MKYDEFVKLGNSDLSCYKKEYTELTVTQIEGQIMDAYRAMITANDPTTYFAWRNFAYKRIDELAKCRGNSTYYKDMFNRNSYNALISCYKKYSFKAKLECPTASAARKRIDQFWQVAAQYLSFENVYAIKQAVKHYK